MKNEELIQKCVINKWIMMSWRARSGGDTKNLLVFYMIFSFIVIEWHLTYYESMEHENYLKLFSLLVF